MNSWKEIKKEPRSACSNSGASAIYPNFFYYWLRNVNILKVNVMVLSPLWGVIDHFKCKLLCDCDV